MVSRGSILASLVLLSVNYFITTEGKSKKYHVPNMPATWFKANEYCNSLKMRLVTFETQQEQEAVIEYVQSTDQFSHEGADFWIGATDLTEEGRFTWMGTGERVVHTNWRPNEPNNKDGKEDCVHIEYKPKYDYIWTWNDANCDDVQYKLYFICESIESDCNHCFCF